MLCCVMFYYILSGQYMSRQVVLHIGVEGTIPVITYRAGNLHWGNLATQTDRYSVECVCVRVCVRVCVSVYLCVCEGGKGAIKDRNQIDQTDQTDQVDRLET